VNRSHDYEGNRRERSVPGVPPAAAGSRGEAFRGRAVVAALARLLVSPEGGFLFNYTSGTGPHGACGQKPCFFKIFCADSKGSPATVFDETK